MARNPKTVRTPEESSPKSSLIQPWFADFEPAAPALHRPRSLHLPVPIPHTRDGGRRPPEGPGRPGKEELQPRDIVNAIEELEAADRRLVFDFTNAVKNGTLPSFLTSYFEQHGMPPELVRKGWQRINAVHQRSFRGRMSPDEAKATKEAKAAYMRDQRNKMTPEEAKAAKTAKAAYMRDWRERKKAKKPHSP